MKDVPEKIGKYTISGIAGRGNMGVVYRGHDPFMNRDVAVKVCSMAEEESAESNRLTRRMFFNEAHTAGSLDHPNILKIYDAGEEGGDAYIVMEYVEQAETLKAHCDSQHLLPVRRVAEIIHKCTKALDYAHRRGVIHRDIKPSNVILTKDREVKLSDFGIAQRVTADDTHVMGMVGSPLYMSPEQAQEEPIISQTDIFSLGVVMYELLSGHTPFTAPTFSRLMYKIVHEDPEPVSRFNPEVPQALERIVTRALAKKPSDRYDTCAEMGAALAAAFSELEQPTPELTDDEKFDLLRGLKFFNDFSDSEVREVVQASTWEQHLPGERIIAEGQLGNSFYIIVDGDVSVTKGYKEISGLSTGDCFGEMGYVTRSKRTASIVAKDDVSLVKINSALMDQASIGCQLRFNQMFLYTLIERLARTSGALARRM